MQYPFSQPRWHNIVPLLLSFMLFLFAFPHEAHADSGITFAAYGDIPYLVDMGDGRTDKDILFEDIAPGIRNRDDLPFVFHLGDTGRPEDACSDEWLEQNQEFWTNDIVHPVFYIVGDNDWTDCDRESVPNRSSEIERLKAVRRVMFSSPKVVNPEWRYTTQPELPENAMWWYKDILFVTQHYVSTDNGRSQILLDDPEEAIALVDERDAANRKWLNQAFLRAAKRDAAAVVVAAHLDPFGPAIADETPLSRCVNNPAYKDFCLQLQRQAAEFDKPVLFLHGDTNAYCLDQPFSQKKAPKLWRLNAPGDYQYIDADLVSIYPDSDRPFEAIGLLSGEPAPDVCDYSY